MLEIRNLSVEYAGGAQGLQDVSLNVPDASLVLLGGRNGSGKTTLLRAVAGFLPVERVRVRGQVLVEGHDVAGSTPIKTDRHKVAIVLERDKAFVQITVRDHFRILKAPSTSVEAAIDVFPPLKDLMAVQAGYLSGGERQMLALAMALAREPRVLLVDELSLGLAPAIVESLLETLVMLRDDRGISVLLVEQDITAALQVCDSGYVLDHGRVAVSGTRETLAPKVLADAYFGDGEAS